MASSGTISGATNRDELIILSLASGATLDEAAAAAGVSKRTVCRRLDSEEFRRRVRHGRLAIWNRAGGRIAAMQDRAVAVLDKLLDSGNEQIQIQAVRVALDAKKGCLDGDINERLSDIQDRLDARDKNRPQTPAALGDFVRNAAG